MSISEEQVKNALKSVKYPGFTRDIVSFGLVKSVEIENGEVKVQIALATNDPNVPAAIKSEAEKALRTDRRCSERKSLDRYSCAARRRRHRHGSDPNPGNQTRDRGGKR